MSAPSLRSTSVLTEHLEYPPVSLVDDIINAVNETMYKCTSAMEKYLLDRSEVDGVSYEEEIRVGVAKLESLMESAVDRNFDKLELYVLRNVLRVPEELLDAGVFRLKHQVGLEVVDPKLQHQVEIELEDKVRELETAFETHAQLKKKVRDLKTVAQRLNRFEDLLVRFVKEQGDDAEGVLRSLRPLDDTLKLLVLQLKRLYIESEENCSMDKVNTVVESTRQNGYRPNSSRTKYIDASADLVLEKLLHPTETDTSHKN